MTFNVLFAMQLLFAQGDEQQNPLGSMLFMFLLMGVAAYLLLIRPARNQERQRRAILAQLKKNDRVITIGGIFGTVTHIKEQKETKENQDPLTMDDEVTLRVDDNCRIKVLRSAIYRILTDEETKDAPPAPPPPLNNA